MEKLSGLNISQDNLELAYRMFDQSGVEPEKYVPFLDSGPYAESREVSFRETDDYAVPCVLDSDVPKVQSLLVAKGPVDGYVVPVPRKYANERRPEDFPLPPLARGRLSHCRYDKAADRVRRPRSHPDGGQAR